MEVLRQARFPRDVVGAAVLVVTAAAAMPLDQIVITLQQLGGPSWHPASDVVLAVVDGLIEDRLLEICGAEGERPCLAPTPQARDRLGEILDLIPLSGLGPDIVYRLKVVGIDLVDDRSRHRLVSSMADHLHRQRQQWTDALSRCPAATGSLRHWLAQNLNRTKAELAWLSSVGGDRQDVDWPTATLAQAFVWPPAVANR